MKNLVITHELKIQLELLSAINPDYVTDLIMALIETLNGIHQDPDDMPIYVRSCYLYWIEGNMASIIETD